MLLKISFPREAKKMYDEVWVDIQGVKVEDPTAFITTQYNNTKTGERGGASQLPVTTFDEYPGVLEEETKEPEAPKVENATIIEDDISHSPLPHAKDKEWTNHWP